MVEITVARMEVPCCGGIRRIVLQAHELAGSDVSVNDVSEHFTLACDCGTGAKARESTAETAVPQVHPTV
ncbi:MAG: hypothetical protein JXQ75_14220, partial [Phycisphaerae bacterium]|nr:hypothetical protein [Phycisphaerae bacterium]